MRKQRHAQFGRAVSVLGVLTSLLVGCVADSQRSRADVDPYGRRTLYEQPYQQRQYGPWDMPGAATQPGPPTWYGCPQQAQNCYRD